MKLTDGKDVHKKKVEELCFYYLCLEDFNEAKKLISFINEENNNQKKLQLVRMLLIILVRPFMNNKGELKKTHKLSKKVVLSEHKELFHRIKELRNRVIAHTDVDFRDVKLSEFGMSLKGVCYDYYINLVDQIQDVKMIESMIVNLGMMINQARKYLGMKII